MYSPVVLAVVVVVVTRLVVGVARVHNDRALLRHMTAQCWRQFDHVWREGADGGQESILARGGVQDHAVGGCAGNEQWAGGQRGIGVGHDFGAQAQRAGVIRQ